MQSQALLDHAIDPQGAVDEIARILKPGGSAYFEIAFMQPLHAVPSHFMNVRPKGVQHLCRNLKAIEKGELGGLVENVGWTGGLDRSLSADDLRRQPVRSTSGATSPEIMSAMTAATAQAKRLVRRALDKAVHPYLVDLADRIEQVGQRSGTSEPAAATEVDSNATSVVFHNTLHELRTMELERVRKGARRAVSVGASGRWYFDWFEQHYGELDSHVGVEAFEPRPDDLPDYVTWIKSTADRFEGIDDDAVDLVFAGQTTEHLWAQELADFLLESARVLPPGGQLVVDSPNRLVTEHLHWSHGGHTVELSAGEFMELLRLAGFEPVRVSGDWLTRFEGRIWQLEEGLEQPAVLTRRIAGATADPDDCFIWWIDAERTHGAPEPDMLRARVSEMFDAHWNTRVSRGMWAGPGSPGPHLGTAPAEWVSSLPMMLHAGRWVLTVRSERTSEENMRRIAARLSAPGDLVLDERSPDFADAGSASFEFDLEHLWMALVIQLRAVDIEDPIRLDMPVDLRWHRS